MSYLDVNNVTLPVDAHVCGQRNWAFEVNEGDRVVLFCTALTMFNHI